MRVLKGKNVAPKKLPPQVVNKSPDQFVYAPKKAKPSRNSGTKMLARGMRRLAAKKK